MTFEAWIRKPETEELQTLSHLPFGSLEEHRRDADATGMMRRSKKRMKRVSEGLKPSRIDGDRRTLIELMDGDRPSLFQGFSSVSAFLCGRSALPDTR
jgi:hypothetical protein